MVVNFVVVQCIVLVYIGYCRLRGSCWFYIGGRCGCMCFVVFHLV